MPLPDIRVAKDDDKKLEVQGANGVYQQVEPTVAKNGSKLLIVQGTGLENFGLEEKDFKKRDAIGTHSGAATGVLVLNPENEVIAIVVGRMNSSKDKFTATSIKYNDGKSDDLPDRANFNLEGKSGARKFPENAAREITRHTEFMVNVHAGEVARRAKSILNREDMGNHITLVGNKGEPIYQITIDGIQTTEATKTKNGNHLVFIPESKMLNKDINELPRQSERNPKIFDEKGNVNPLALMTGDAATLAILKDGKVIATVMGRMNETNNGDFVASHIKYSSGKVEKLEQPLLVRLDHSQENTKVSSKGDDKILANNLSNIVEDLVKRNNSKTIKAELGNNKTSQQSGVNPDLIAAMETEQFRTVIAEIEKIRSEKDSVKPSGLVNIAANTRPHKDQSGINPDMIKALEKFRSDSKNFPSEHNTIRVAKVESKDRTV